MAQYLEMSDCEPAHTQSHKAWMTMGQAVKMGHSVRFPLPPLRSLGQQCASCRLACVSIEQYGTNFNLNSCPPSLDMNSSRWRLADSAALQRSRVFWQLFFQDTWLVS